MGVVRVHSFIAFTFANLEYRLAFIYSYVINTDSHSLQYYDDGNPSPLRCTHASAIGPPCAYVVLDPFRPNIHHVTVPPSNAARINIE
jgi:hypothetical protein